MNPILAVFYKEYRETRTTTIVFWLLGVLFPLIKLLELKKGYGFFPSFFEADLILLGGLLSVWLNAAVLCATSFARERKKRTFETLRRVAPDWRVAVAGKFGYALISSFALAMFFCVESYVVAKICWQRPFAAFLDFARSGLSYSSDGTIALVFALTTVCWGVFWTGRVVRQTSAIVLTFLCPFLITFVALTIFVRIEFSDMNSNFGLLDHFVVERVVGAFGLLALVVSPFRKRFGYLDAEKRIEPTSSESGSDVSWKQIDVRNKRAFPTLLSLAFTDAALLFKSPFSILLELAILFAFAFFANNPSNRNATLTDALLFYYLCFASGLFLDSKRKNSIVQERLDVKPGAYWLVNAFAAFLVWAIAFGAYQWKYGIRLAWPLGWQNALLSDLNTETMSTFLLLFSVSLWIAALKVSRLVVWLVSLVVFNLIRSRLIDAFYDRARVVVDGGNYDWRLVHFACLLIFALLALVFTIASYRIVTRRAIRRKAPWSVAVPIILLVAFGAFAANHAHRQSASKHDIQPTAPRVLLQTRVESGRLVDDAKTRSSLVTLVSPPRLLVQHNPSSQYGLNELERRELHYRLCQKP